MTWHTLKISHVGPDIGVQGVDDHLAVGRARDLDAAVDEARGGGGALPCRVVADVLGLGQEVGEGALVQLGLADLAALEEGLAGWVEGALEQGEEGQGLRGQDLALRLLDRAEDGDALEDGLVAGHGVCLGGGVYTCGREGDVVYMDYCFLDTK